MDDYSHCRILLVDDAKTNIDVLVQLLKNDYKLGVALDGEKALKYVQTNPPDLILLDVVMPGMDGYEVLTRLKGGYTHRHIPVIMVSALDEMDSVIKCIELGADDYLAKPFDPVLLRARIRAGLEKKLLREKEIDYLVKIKNILKQQNYELAQAAAYVKTLLPAPINSGPVRTDWRFIPSTSLGGDSFGYHWLDDHRFAVYLLDVCGHGVGAALLSVSVLNVLRSQSLPGVDFAQPQQVLHLLNDTFPGERHNDMHFSIWYGVLDLSTRALTFASGGHPPALILCQSQGEPEKPMLLHTRNLVVGALPNRSYTQAEIPLDGPGRLYLFSDGVYEISLADGSKWQFDNFIDFMSQPQHGLQPDLDGLLRHVQSLSLTTAMSDDFSVLEVTFD